MLLAMRILLGGSLILHAEEPKPISLHEALPFGQQPVDYWSKDSDNVIAALQRRLDSQELELPFVEQFGYLPAILKELDIPVESQLLAFSSQSPHRHQIRPERPRAVYFNDDVSVAWFPGVVLLEIAAQDARKGTVFYTVVNRGETPPEFYRSNSQTCLGCHHMPANPTWTGVAVPGHLLRSFLKAESLESKVEDQTQTPSGFRRSMFDPQPSRLLRCHALPLEDRWETWYVSGIHPEQRHRGNLTLAEHQRLKSEDPAYHRALADFALDFDTARYPTSTSDVVSHLIYDHQMLGLNLLARLSYEHQFQVRSDIENIVVRYLLMIDEAPLNQPVAGESKFAAWYRQRGPQDTKGNSLYELELETRLFKHRISPLVNCRMVREFPPKLQQRLFQRMNAALTGQESIEGYSAPPADRQTTLTILRATLKNWPPE